ncbi:MAG TPA: arginine deiminase family protein [Thermoanaerobaculia bacterium]
MIAITRDVSPSIERCELTHVERSVIDYERACLQHERYRELLSSLGCRMITIDADPGFPDSVFVEDAAIVLDDLAVITRPGAESRRGETSAVAVALAPFRKLVHIEAPATLDGGDVLVLDDRIFVGLSDRSNHAAIDQLRRLTGRAVTAVVMSDCLHLKTAITQVSRNQLVVNRAWVDVAPFEGWELIDVAPGEPFGGNAVLLGDVVVYPAAYGDTRRRLEERGIEVRTVEADELAKAEGGVTCCSLLVR